MSESENLNKLEELAEGMNYKDIPKAIKILERVGKAKENQERRKAQEELRKTAREHGFDLEELVAGATPRRGGGGGKVPPKYRDPDSGKTWTGRGRKPKWVEEKLAEGRDMEEFRITGEG